MEFSEPHELNDLLKFSSGAFSRKTNNTSQNNGLSILETMMNYGLDLEDKLNFSPHAQILKQFSTQLDKNPDLEEPQTEVNIEKEEGPVVLQVEKDENFKETYAQSLCRVSNLTESLRFDSRSKKPVGLFKTVFLFGSQDKMRVNLPKKSTVDQLVCKVISMYIKEQRAERKPLPCGPIVEAYEIRYLDSSNQPESDGAIDKSTRIKDLEANELGFCIKPGYDLAKSELVFRDSSENGKTVKVYYEKTCNLVHISLDQPLRKLLEALSSKFGYLNPEEFEFKVVLPVEEITEQECSLNMDLKIGALATDELKLDKKCYIDTPSISEKTIVRRNSPLKDLEKEVRFDMSRSNMTRAQAIAYKEYEVIKTNNKGRRQKRVLGINQLRLHNMTLAQARKKIKEKALEENEKNVIKNKFKVMFNSIITQHPEIPIANIHCVEQDSKNLCCFYIEYTERNTKKRKLYETEKSSITVEILAKISKLIQLVMCM